MSTSIQSDVTWFQEAYTQAASAVGNRVFSGQLFFDEPLQKHTYYRIGGPAAVFAIPKSIEDLKWLVKGIQATGIQFFILGQGSNVLVSDLGFDGLIIRASRLNLDIELLKNGNLRTGASVAVSSLLRRASQEGWMGLEFLTGIPGSVGGVVVMNAGTHLGEAQNRIRKVEAFSLQDNQTMNFEGEQLIFQYRKNLFLPSGCLIHTAEWQVEKAEPSRVKSIIDETLARRKATQPTDYPSCGSVFKNPKASGYSAWQVIDQLGLRGYQIGNAQFSEKHSNFIINLGGAIATDVLALIQLAKQRALKEMGVSLEEEVIHLERSS